MTEEQYKKYLTDLLNGLKKMVDISQSSEEILAILNLQFIATRELYLLSLT